MATEGRVRCSRCGRICAGRFPAGGDGSAQFPTRHYVPDDLGTGSYYGPRKAWCDGRWEPGKPVRDDER